MDLLHSSKNEERKTQMKFVYILQDFNMVKIESRLQTISIRQAFLIGNESYSGMRIWCLVRVGSSPTASTKCWFIAYIGDAAR